MSKMLNGHQLTKAHEVCTNKYPNTVPIQYKYNTS